MFRTPTVNLIVGVGAFSLAGIIMYVWYKNKDEDEDQLDNANSKKKLQNNKNADVKKNQKFVTIKVIIPNDKVPIIVGRTGANLKSIESKSGATISFKEKDLQNQFCEIYGTSESVNLAKELLLKEINRSTNVKEEIMVPQSACGKIYGRTGEALHEICRKSLAKVSVDSGDRNGGGDELMRKVTITGNRAQVEIAKKLIQEKVKEDEEYRKSLEETELKREPRRSPAQSVSSLHSSMTSLTSNTHLPIKEKFQSNDTEKPFEVYVSAIASPAKFWLQMIGPQTRQLDELVENMTEYYSNEENQQIHKIADPYLGQIVAALFKYDGKWYRAEIIGILPNEYNPRDVVLDLYFVDYGDSEYVQPDEVFELRMDFLTLRFQAIECFLANVRPIGSLDSDIWDQATTTKFEELTHVASWKKLKSRIVTYKERPRGGNHIRREGSPVPGVELFDNIEGTEVNIGHILITHGFALPDYQETSTANFTGAENQTEDHKSAFVATNNFENNLSTENDPNEIIDENEPLPPPPPPRTYLQIYDNAEHLSDPHSNLNFNGNATTTINIKEPILNNTKLESQNFINSEILPNGNGVQNGSNLNHNFPATQNHTFS